MNACTQGRLSGNGRAATEEVGAGRRLARRSKRRETKGQRPPPIDRVLPPDLLAELRKAVTGEIPPTREQIEQLDKRFGIRKRYGVTRLRLRNFLNKLSSSTGEASATVCTDDGADEGAEWKDKVGAHRRRQASVASIIDQVFGEFALSNPDLWERRAYLLLVGHVYERLASDVEEIPTDDLAKLARVLAENRRYEGRPRNTSGGEEPGEPPPSSPGDLPDRFADVVRQVYGTNFQTSSAE